MAGNRSFTFPFAWKWLQYSRLQAQITYFTSHLWSCMCLYVVIFSVYSQPEAVYSIIVWRFGEVIAYPFLHWMQKDKILSQCSIWGWLRMFVICSDSETMNMAMAAEVVQINPSDKRVKCKSFHENGELSRGHTIPQLVSIANAVEILSLVLHSSLWSNGTDMLQPFSNLPNCTWPCR